MSAPDSGDASHRTVIVDLTFLAVPNLTLPPRPAPGSRDLMINMTASFIPKWCPSGKGPRRGSGFSMPNIRPYLAMKRTWVRWPATVLDEWAQKASSVAREVANSKASSSTSPGTRSAPRMFWD